jgi:DNA-binding transcriptional ArsR family regulator
LAVLKLLRNEELCVSDLVLKLHLPQPKVSLILKELRDLRLVLVKVNGKNRLYRVNNEVVVFYKTEINKMLSDFDSNGGDELIIRRKVLFSN